MKFYTNINLNGNEIKRVSIEKCDTEPLSPVEGQIYYDTRTKSIRVFNGIEWGGIGSGSGGSYLNLTDKPTIETKKLEGDLTLEDIGLNFLTNTEIDLLLK